MKMVITAVKRIIQFLFTPAILLFLRIKKHVTISLFTRLNSKTVLEGYNRIGNSIISNSFIGRGTYIGKHCSLSNCEIGRFCSIGSNVKVLSATHPTTQFVSTHPAFFSGLKQAGFSFVTKSVFNEVLFYNKEKEVVAKIGNDVWIGDDVTIIGGHEIGDGAVVATGSVITKDVKAYSIVGGVPAEVKKERFDLAVRNRLIQMQWWNRDMKWLHSHAALFRDVSDILEYEDNNA